MTILLLSISGINGQTNKGNFIVGGSSNLSHAFGSAKYRYDGTTYDDYNFIQLNLQPMVGYFFIHNFTGGLFIDWNYRIRKEPDDDKFSFNTITTGPFIRYYFLPKKSFKPFVHGQFGYGAIQYKSVFASGNEYKDKYVIFNFKTGAGVAYFFNDHVSIEALACYNRETWTQKESDNGGERSSDNYKEIRNSYVLQFGVNVVLGKK